MLDKIKNKNTERRIWHFFFLINLLLFCYANFFSIEEILDLLEASALRLRQQELDEEEGKEGEHGEYPEGEVHANGVTDGPEELCDDEADHPADGGGDGRYQGLDAGVQKFSDHSPGERSES